LLLLLLLLLLSLLFDISVFVVGPQQHCFLCLEWWRNPPRVSIYPPRGSNFFLSFGSPGTALTCGHCEGASSSRRFLAISSSCWWQVRLCFRVLFAYTDPANRHWRLKIERVLLVFTDWNPRTDWTGEQTPAGGCFSFSANRNRASRLTNGNTAAVVLPE